MKRYNPADIEPKWQSKWAESQIYAAQDFDDKPKFVMLTEFPYPSGAGLHMGHLREYTLGDIMARHKRAQGYNVLFPMGYDAFGLPTENYAIKNKISPQAATEANTAAFRRTLDMMGYSIDWNRSFATSDPEYYRWTQWMFLQFYKAGLAYRDEIAINWCPFCKTGLANEEVVNGRHERCDNLVEKKLLKQWMLRITDYAERLIDGLRSGVDYPSRIADQQINWIGKSIGAEIDFAIDGYQEKLRVFTTRPDTIFGAIFMVLAPEHELVAKITSDDQRERINEYVKAAQSKSDIERQENKEKTGVPTGAYAINPATNEKIPIWVADYVLMGYGTGAIMAVPFRDERDREFAEKFDLSISEAELTDEKFGVEKVNYKLRDWVYSRQHYWGEPIPIIYCPEHGAVPVPNDQLPVELPPVDHYEPTDDGQSPLSKITDWVNTTCPECGRPAKRETDTMPNWAGSNWYYLRYYDAHNDQVFASPEKLAYWGAVDLYLGGMEHTTLHLLYSRFHHQFLYDQGLVPTPEPYVARRGQGIILAADGRKMSKSLGNVVDPTPIVESGYGADATRLAVTFLAPFDQTTPWSPETVAGCYRFLGRVWGLAQQVIRHSAPESSDELLRIQHRTIKKVSDDLDKMNFNTAIAALMEYLNTLSKDTAQVSHENLEALLVLLAPFAPHIAAELYKQLGHETPIEQAGWPTVDEKYLVDDQIAIAIQVNGKLRGEITVDADETRENIEKLALEQENVVKFIGNQKPARVIYVPGKIVNVVVI
jgi:leucyl-tRNA synthetase